MSGPPSRKRAAKVALTIEDPPSASMVSLNDLPGDVLRLIFPMCIVSFFCHIKMRNVCKRFNGLLDSFDIFSHLSMAHEKMSRHFGAVVTLRSVSREGPPGHLVRHPITDELNKKHNECLFRQTYKHVAKHVAMLLPCRARCVLLMRDIVFNYNDDPRFPPYDPPQYELWGRVVAYHRSVSIFDRYCRGVKKVFDYVPELLCRACSVLGYVSSVRSQEGDSYLREFTLVDLHANWYMEPLCQAYAREIPSCPEQVSLRSMIEKINEVISVLVNSEDPSVRGDISHSYTTRDTWYWQFVEADLKPSVFPRRSKINHPDDFALLYAVVNRLVEKRYFGREKERILKDCLLFMDLCLQTELAFFPDKQTLGRDICLFAARDLDSVSPELRSRLHSLCVTCGLWRWWSPYHSVEEQNPDEQSSTFIRKCRPFDRDMVCSYGCCRE